MRLRRGAWVVGAALWAAVLSVGCHHRPQELPVVVSADSDGAHLQWRDAEGPLRGEVPWVLRTDVMGPDTFLVVETPAGDECARRVSFRVRAGGAIEYEVTLTSDLAGRVSWRVTHGDQRGVKLFTCEPRPADSARRECLHGGIPKPLFGELVGGFSAELESGEPVRDVRTVRFERAFPCPPGPPGPASTAGPRPGGS